MSTKALPEVWLRGPVPGIPALLQPVAHALLQAREEVTALMDEVRDEQLWDRPGGVASPGFHLQHLTGVLDRLFTYAAGKALSGEQLAQLAAEGTPEWGRLGHDGDPVWGEVSDSGASTVPENSVDLGEGARPAVHREVMAGGGRTRVKELVNRFNKQVDKVLEQLKGTPEQILTETRGVGRAQLPSTVIGLMVHAAEHTQRHTGQLLVTVRILKMVPQATS